MVAPAEATFAREDEFGKRYEHPAFGNITVTRASGGYNLFDVDYKTYNHIRLEINTAELHRGLNHNRIHADKSIISIVMSESQFATLITSLNMGGGVPCTIERRDGHIIPGIVNPRTTEIFESELKESVKETADRLRKSIRDLSELKGEKGKVTDIRRDLEKSLQDLEKNYPFIADSFSGHMERTVERAKQEVNGYATNKLMSIGMDAIQNKQLGKE